MKEHIHRAREEGSRGAILALFPSTFFHSSLVQPVLPGVLIRHCPGPLTFRSAQPRHPGIPIHPLFSVRPINTFPVFRLSDIPHIPAHFQGPLSLPEVASALEASLTSSVCNSPAPTRTLARIQPASALTLTHK